jgi:transcriptional regulator with XRE-family HTH domain
VDPAVAAAFGQAVLSLRTAAGMSQEALALAASIGRANMSAFETGRSTPSLTAIVKIAAALGCSLPVLAKEFERAYRVRSGEAGRVRRPRGASTAGG